MSGLALWPTHHTNEVGVSALIADTGFFKGSHQHQESALQDVDVVGEFEDRLGDRSRAVVRISRIPNSVAFGRRGTQEETGFHLFHLKREFDHHAIKIEQSVECGGQFGLRL